MYSGSLIDAVFLREMGHALGCGSAPWINLDLLKNPSLTPFQTPIDPAPGTYFSGTKAIAAGTLWSTTTIQHGLWADFSPGVPHSDSDKHWHKCIRERILAHVNVLPAHTCPKTVLKSNNSSEYAILEVEE